jgi:hypothetical protein
MNLPGKIQQIMSYSEFLKLMFGSDKGALRAPLSLPNIFFVLMGRAPRERTFFLKIRDNSWNEQPPPPWLVKAKHLHR